MTDHTFTRPDITLDLAQRLIEGAFSEARSMDLAMGAAVVDAGGNVVASARMDGAQLVGIPLATDKAYTAAAIGLPTEEWATSTQPGRPDWGMHTVLGGKLVVFAGGVPIRVHGALVGGLGVSGSAASDDQRCAVAGLRAAGLEQSSS